MTHKIKVMTVVGTRPEIIRLSATIKLLDKTTNHILVHTGQNYDYQLNEVFFEDLGLRKPDYFLNADVSSLGATLGSILQGTEKVIHQEKPDAMLILGDTNSCISAIMGKRMKIPVYHMEAGNRCFDENVPEETNRKLVDHVADYNLVYTEHARRNLLFEGIHPSKILLTGSPMLEVLLSNKEMISRSKIISDLELSKNNYFLVSIHREENVDNNIRLKSILSALVKLKQIHQIPVLVSTHPRTHNRIIEIDDEITNELRFHKPFGFNEYIHLQQNARLVLSDSGTISEESSLLGFPAVTLRDAIERPEAQDEAAILLTGTKTDEIVECATIAIKLFSTLGAASIPREYEVKDVSRKVVNFIFSTARTHASRSGIRVNEN